MAHRRTPEGPAAQLTGVAGTPASARTPCHSDLQAPVRRGADQVVVGAPDPVVAAGHEAALAGNQRFVAGTPEHPNQDATRRAETAPSQQPFAVLFGCSDSRLAAEIIFDRGLGDLFVVRTAGHVMGPDVLGSIEFGVEVLGCPLVVILGHDSCGAVGAACAALEDGVTPTGTSGTSSSG